MGKKTGLARQIAELTEKPPIDFDPEENIAVESSDDNSDSQDSDDDQLGTEHYLEVSKSKLRKQDEVPLGPNYAGSRISRKALLDNDSADSDYEDANEFHEASNFADPDASDMDIDEEDGDIDSEKAFGDGDEEKFKNFTFRGSGTTSKMNVATNKKKKATDFVSVSEDDEAKERRGSSAESDKGQDSEKIKDDENNLEPNDSEETSDSNSDQEGQEDEMSSDSDSGDDEAPQDETARREELRKIMSEQKSVVATISQAAKADTEKGRAVKRQRKTFDSLLNVRIRLQKALIASNSMAEAPEKSEVVENSDDDALPYRAAEEAAVKLLDTLDGMRYELNKASERFKGSKKRKRAIELDTPNSRIWETIQKSEAQAIQTRQSTLEKWSARVRDAAALPISSKLNNTTTPQTIVPFLTAQLANPDRLIKRTQMPRSCAPLQAQLKQSYSPHIYDDADFYQLLLKELVDQRMAESTATGTNGGSSTSATAVPHWTAVREAKAKRHVDTKASKGRKMRYTVHEKLQNFMAPEDRATWEPEAVDRFFSTLLGRKVGLAEDEVSDGEETPLAEETLMLFRS